MHIRTQKSHLCRPKEGAMLRNQCERRARGASMSNQAGLNDVRMKEPKASISAHHLDEMYQ